MARAGAKGPMILIKPKALQQEEQAEGAMGGAFSRRRAPIRSVQSPPPASFPLCLTQVFRHIEIYREVTSIRDNIRGGFKQDSHVNKASSVSVSCDDERYRVLGSCRLDFRSDPFNLIPQNLFTGFPGSRVANVCKQRVLIP